MKQMNKEIKKNIAITGNFEDVVEINNHYYLVSKKQRLCVLPFTISEAGILDQIGVIKDFNYLSEKYEYTLINGYINEDDGTSLVTSNRLLFNIIGTNVTSADNWIYLGSLFNNLTSDSPITIYGVNISNLNIKSNEDAVENQDKIKFEMLDTFKVVQSNESLFLAAYLRLFEWVYTNSLINK
jgi:hypothetical protein